MAKLHSTLFIALSPTDVDVSAFLGCLRSHPDLLCHADMHGPLSEAGYLAPDGKTYPSGKASKADIAFKREFPEAFFYKYVMDSRGKQAVGFAADHGALLDPPNARVRNALYHDTEVKVLLCAPKNLLRSYTEDALRKQAASRSGSGSAEVEAQKFVLHAKQTDRMNAYVEQFFKSHDLLRIDTGDLEPSRLRSVMKGVAKFLDIEPYRDGALPKYAPQPELGALISNLPALKPALRDTPYSWMADS